MPLDLFTDAACIFDEEITDSVPAVSGRSKNNPFRGRDDKMRKPQLVCPLFSDFCTLVSVLWFLVSVHNTPPFKLDPRLKTQDPRLSRKPTRASMIGEATQQRPLVITLIIFLTKTPQYANFCLMNLLNLSRRKFLSRICELSFQIMFGAAFLSEFFVKISIPIKTIIAIAIVSSILLGTIITPNDKGAENE